MARRKVGKLLRGRSGPRACDSENATTRWMRPGRCKFSTSSDSPVLDRSAIPASNRQGPQDVQYLCSSSPRVHGPWSHTTTDRAQQQNHHHEELANPPTTRGTGHHSPRWLKTYPASSILCPLEVTLRHKLESDDPCPKVPILKAHGQSSRRFGTPTGLPSRLNP